MRPEVLREQIQVVVPAMNEGATIEQVILGCQPFAAHILVVDGHSTDDTAAIAAKNGAEVVVDRGKGKGDAIRTSFPYLRYPITVFIDADGSHDPRDIPRLAESIYLGQADHVIGSRLLGGSSEFHGGFSEWVRLAGGAFVTACINWKFGTSLSESQNGFRAWRTQALIELRINENSTAIEQELLIESLCAGHRVLDVPTHEHRRKGGESKIYVPRVIHRYAITLLRGLFLRRMRAPSLKVSPVAPSASSSERVTFATPLAASRSSSS